MNQTAGMKWLAITIFTLLSFNVLAQGLIDEPCVTEYMTQKLIDKNPNITVELAQLEQQLQNAPVFRGNRSVQTIAVVIHVVYNNFSENVTDQAIDNVINTLNNDFRNFNDDFADTRAVFKSLSQDMELEFCLDQVIRKQTSETCFDLDTQDDDMKYNSSGGSNTVDPDHYLNIWICDICPDGTGGGGTAGYAYLPFGSSVGSSYDGVVIDYALGFQNGYGRTVTHEVGHYLGLRHTWGSSGGCNNDDGVSDTPTSSGPNYGCTLSTNSCTDAGTDLPDMLENYMDYSDCTVMFTAGQISRMNSTLGSIRNGLFSGNNCNNQFLEPRADFGSVLSGGCEGVTIQFEDQSFYRPSSWQWTFTGGNPAISNVSNPTVTYNNQGVYHVSLTVTNTAGTTSETKSAFIEIGNGPSISHQIVEGTCQGKDVGIIDLTINGGVAPFTYQWSNGSITQDIINASEGINSVTVTDASGCGNTRLIDVPTIGASLTTSIINPATDVEDGSISVLLAGGITPYTYAWSNGATTNNVGGLEPGTHTLTITDASGCETVQSFNVPNRRSDAVDPTAVEAISDLMIFKLTPNPARGNVILDISLSANNDLTWQLIDLSGKVLAEKSYLLVDKLQDNLNLTIYPQGLYFIKLVSNKQTVTRRLMVM